MWEVGADGQADEVAFSSEYPEAVMALAFVGPDLVIGAEGGAIRRWPFGVGGAMASFQEPDEEVDITSMAFSVRGILAVGEDEGVIQLRHPGDYAVETLLEGHTGTINNMAFSTDGRILASGSDDGTLRLWNVDAGEELIALTDHTHQIRDLALSASGDIASASMDGKVRMWQLTSSLHGDFYSGHQGYIFESLMGAAWSAAISPDMHTLAFGDNFFVWLKNMASGESSGSFMLGPIVHSVAFSPDGSLVAAGGGLGEGVVRVWDIETGDEVLTLEGRTGSLVTVLFDPTGATLLTGGTGETNDIQVWDIATGNELARFQGHTGGVFSLAFSPDATLLASGSGDDTVRLWNVATQEELAVLAGHTSEVDALAFSPDGALLISGSHDRSIRVWDVETGKLLVVIEDLLGGVTGLAFTPDGELLVSGGSDGTVRLWGVESLDPAQ
ncbi:MAG: WD40 repeat domain-containing protein [Anaerolineae bacterium]|nr:WD40 repeat domain-containing protein [Anaerolineae bacterium]